MLRDLSASAYPLIVRPLVPLSRVLFPVVFGNRALLKATRSSVYLASSPDVEGITGTYFDTNGEVAEWPDAARDETNRTTVWNLCVELLERFERFR
jgi:hypothetical protein